MDGASEQAGLTIKKRGLREIALYLTVLGLAISLATTLIGWVRGGMHSADLWVDTRAATVAERVSKGVVGDSLDALRQSERRHHRRP